MMSDKEKKARQILKRLFKDVSDAEVSRDVAIERVGIKPFQNNTGPMRDYGYVEYDRAEGLGRKILTIRLTDKGRGVIAEAATAVEQPDPLTNLDALGDFVRRFNAYSEFWELKLVPKDRPM